MLHIKLTEIAVLSLHTSSFYINNQPGLPQSLISGNMMALFQLIWSLCKYTKLVVV